MWLHEADGLLELTQMRIARGEREVARASIATAKEMVSEMEYHRRNGEVEAPERACRYLSGQ